MMMILNLGFVVRKHSINIEIFSFFFIVDGANTPGSIDNITMSPLPIEVSTRGNISIYSEITLTEPIREGSRLQLNIFEDGLIPLPIPCSWWSDNDSMDGPCLYNISDLLDKPLIQDWLCPDHLPQDQDCSLPLNPGRYGGDPVFETRIVDFVPVSFINLCSLFLGSGIFSVEVEILNPDGSQMTCIKLRFSAHCEKYAETTTTPDSNILETTTESHILETTTDSHILETTTESHRNHLNLNGLFNSLLNILLFVFGIVIGIALLIITIFCLCRKMNRKGSQ